MILIGNLSLPGIFYIIMEQILVVLGLTIFLIAVLKYFNIPSVIAYLIIGCFLGPYGNDLISNSAQMHWLAEIGVVFLLFTIGLELPFSKFMAMRYDMFLIGGCQVLLCTIVLTVINNFYFNNVVISLIVASAMSLSSTVIVLRKLSEQNELFSKHGRLAFAMLIFQDLSVIPLLVVIPVLSALNINELSLSWSNIELLTPVIKVLINGVIVFAIIILFSRSVLKTFFHKIAMTQSLELFMFAVLFTTLFAAYITQTFGLSMTFGAFVAGVGLGESEYRHQIDVELRPFRDILLGIFFISIGMLLNLQVVIDHFASIMYVVLAIFLVKTIIIFILSYYLGRKMDLVSSIHCGLIMGHAGEFGLAIMTIAISYNLIAGELAQIILAAMIFSLFIAVFLAKYSKMFLTMFLMRLPINKNQEKVSYNFTSLTAPELTHYPDHSEHVIICGFGRVGTILAKFLEVENKPYIALDCDPELVKAGTEKKFNIFYGDASRIDILSYCSLNRARLIALCIDDIKTAKKIIANIRILNHKIPILVRTRDLSHRDALLEAGATEVISETIEAGMMLVLRMFLMLGSRAQDIMDLITSTRKDRNFFAD